MRELLTLRYSNNSGVLFFTLLIALPSGRSCNTSFAGFISAAASSGAARISIHQWLDRKAADVPPNSDLVFLPYVLGEKTPLMDPHARGTLVGLGLHHDLRHVWRADTLGPEIDIWFGQWVMVAGRQPSRLALSHLLVPVSTPRSFCRP
jgi:hypothetical protein